MFNLNQDEIRKLTQRPGGWCVSLYMPMGSNFLKAGQNRIRFKNLLREAGEHLRRLGVRSPEVKRLMEPARALLKEKLFWGEQGKGLAAYLAEDLFVTYRLPLAPPKLVVVTDRFHLKPLLPVLSGDGRFFILGLSQNAVRLFQGDRDSLEELELPPGVPHSLEEALPFEEPEKRLQFHTQTPFAAGGRAAMFHGQGGGADEGKNRLLRFFQQVDQGLQPFLNRKSDPLVLAGVDYLLPIFREACRYPFLVEAGVTGNPESWSPEKLRLQSWNLVEPVFLREQESARERYQVAQQSGRASSRLQEIIPKAWDGRIEFLFVPVGVQQWGVFDPEKRTVGLHRVPRPGDDDLLDLAAVQTFLKGGTVYAVDPSEMPNRTLAAATFRY